MGIDAPSTAHELLHARFRQTGGKGDPLVRKSLGMDVREAPRPQRRDGSLHQRGLLTEAGKGLVAVRRVGVLPRAG